MSFMDDYTTHFQSYRHNVSDRARQYACGLMQAGSRKNMDRMAEVVPDSKSRNLQQFLTHSKWNHRDVIDHVAQDANDLLGDSKQSCLLIDETGFAKQGKSSVGVTRQWLGRLGKVDNGQVAVFGVLANGKYATPIDVHMYLPEQWTDNPRRCRSAGIPEEDIKFRTKPELGLEIVRHAKEKGIKFGWVGADAGYGKGPGFCSALDEMGETFVVDLHSDFHVFLEDPQPYIPEQTKKRGRPSKKYQTNNESLEVGEIIKQLPSWRWKTVSLRDTTRGELRVRICRVKVYIWDRESENTKCWTLIATKTCGRNPDTKISLSNASKNMSLKRLGWMQRQRFWVERVFEDCKSECGMADYQVRKWQAWHHHIALVMMSMLFMLTEKIRHKDIYPLLSCSDIEELLARFLPRRDLNKEDVILQMEYRHLQRQNAIDSHARRQSSVSRLE